jgi:ankyrin repeat protein
MFKSLVRLFCMISVVGVGTSLYGMEGKKRASRKKKARTEETVALPVVRKEIPSLKGLCFRAILHNEETVEDINEILKSSLNPLFETSLPLITEFTQEATNIKEHDYHLALKIILIEHLLRKSLEDTEQLLTETEIVDCLCHKYVLYQQALQQGAVVSEKVQFVAKAIELIEHVLTAVEYKDRVFLRPLACACLSDCWLTVGCLLRVYGLHDRKDDGIIDMKNGILNQKTKFSIESNACYVVLDIRRSFEQLMHRDQEKASSLLDKVKLYLAVDLGEPNRFSSREESSLLESYVESLVYKQLTSNLLVQKILTPYPDSLKISKKDHRSWLQAQPHLEHALKTGDLDYIQQTYATEPSKLRDMLNGSAKRVTDANKYPISHSPLGFCLRAGYLSLFELLFKLNLAATKKPEFLQGLLHDACMIGQPSIIKLLLEKISLSEVKGYYLPLHSVCNYGRVEAVNLLLESGADSNQLDGSKLSPLHYACKPRISIGDTTSMIAELLLKHGATLGVQNGQGETPLHYACSAGNFKLAKKLIEHGASVDTPNQQGKTAFIFACEIHMQACSGLLKMQGPALFELENLIYYMLEKKASLPVNYVLERSQIAELGHFVNATKMLRDPVAQSLCKHICMLLSTKKGTLLSPAILTGDVWLLRRLLSQGARMGPNDRALFAVALCYLNKLSIRHPFVESMSKNNALVLHIACIYRNSTLAKELLEKGAPVNKLDGQGDTPLHIACTKSGEQEVYPLETCQALIDLLLLYGADTTLKNKEGYTPLELALDPQKGCPELGQYLKNKLDGGR